VAKGIHWNYDKTHKRLHKTIMNMISKDLIEKTEAFYAMYDDHGKYVGEFNEEVADYYRQSLALLQRAHDWHFNQYSKCVLAIRKQQIRMDLAAVHEDAARVIRRATERANAAEAKLSKFMTMLNEKDRYLYTSLITQSDDTERPPISFRNVTDWSAEFDEAVFREERAQCAAVAREKKLDAAADLARRWEEVYAAQGQGDGWE
jgi:hypothetical protein